MGEFAFVLLACLARQGVVDGSLSTVELVEIRRLIGQASETSEPPVRDGLQFVFVVGRASDVHGVFTLVETREAIVSGRKYPDRNRARHPEPRTTVYSLSDFRRDIRPDLDRALGGQVKFFL